MRPLICAVVLFLAISCDSRSILGEQFPPSGILACLPITRPAGQLAESKRRHR